MPLLGYSKNLPSPGTRSSNFGIFLWFRTDGFWSFTCVEFLKILQRNGFVALLVIVENAVFWHHSLENDFQSYGKWELAYSHSYLWWPGQFVLTYFNFKAKSISFYKSFLYLTLYLSHILFDLMTLLYYWCICILEICSISPLGICTVFFNAGALEHYWVPVMTYANWEPLIL